MGKLEEAVTFYQETIRLDNSNIDALGNMATTLHTLGRHTEAQQYYEMAHQASPLNAILCASYSNLLAVIGQNERAMKIIDDAIAADPTNELLLKTKESIIKQAASNPEFDAKISAVQLAITEAVQVSDWDRVVSIAVDFGEPKDGAVWWYFAVGMGMIFKKEFQTGFDLCQRAAVSEPRSHLVHACIAVAAKNLGEADVSAHHFELAYDTSVSNPPATPPVPNLGFYASKEEIEMGILTSLHDSGNFERCLLWAKELMGIPKLADGGIIVLHLARLQWTQDMVDKLPFAEAHYRSNQKLLDLPTEKSLLQEVERTVTKHRSLLEIANMCLDKCPNDQVQRLKSLAFSIEEVIRIPSRKPSQQTSDEDQMTSGEQDENTVAA